MTRREEEEMREKVGGQCRRLRGKECERKEGREGGKEGTRVRVQDKQSQRERERGECRKGGEEWLEEVCLVFVPACGTLAVCEAVDNINRPPVLVTSSLGAASPRLGSTATHRLHPLSVVHTLYVLIYTHRETE